MADALEPRRTVLAANASTSRPAGRAGTSAAMLDRLALTPAG
jgi:gamma-glutamyl phosphate reductase